MSLTSYRQRREYCSLCTVVLPSSARSRSLRGRQHEGLRETQLLIQLAGRGDEQVMERPIVETHDRGRAAVPDPRLASAVRASASLGDPPFVSSSGAQGAVSAQ